MPEPTPRVLAMPLETEVTMDKAPIRTG